MKIKPLVFGALVASAAVFTSPLQAGQDKAALAGEVLDLWKFEDKAILTMAQKPAAQVLQQSSVALQGRVSEEKQKATMKEIATDVQAFLDEATPLVEKHALALKPEILQPLLEKNFTEQELRELIAILKSPVKQKFERLAPEFDSTYGKAVNEATGTEINSMVQELSKQVNKKLRQAAMSP